MSRSIPSVKECRWSVQEHTKLLAALKCQGSLMMTLQRSSRVRSLTLQRSSAYQARGALKCQGALTLQCGKELGKLEERWCVKEHTKLLAVWACQTSAWARYYGTTHEPQSGTAGPLESGPVPRERLCTVAPKLCLQFFPSILRPAQEALDLRPAQKGVGRLCAWHHVLQF